MWTCLRPWVLLGTAGYGQPQDGPGYGQPQDGPGYGPWYTIRLINVRSSEYGSYSPIVIKDRQLEHWDRGGVVPGSGGSSRTRLSGPVSLYIKVCNHMGLGTRVTSPRGRQRERCHDGLEAIQGGTLLLLERCPRFRYSVCFRHELSVSSYSLVCSTEGGTGRVPRALPTTRVPHGPIWLLHGPTWLHNGPIWLHNGPNRALWLHNGPNRAPWPYIWSLRRLYGPISGP